MKLKVEVTRIVSTGRETVKLLVREHLGPTVEYGHDADGAPVLTGSPLRISASHSRHFAAIALHPELTPGVDIEEERPGQLARVAPRFMSEREMPLWADRLLQAWTCKEAVYKAARTPGLALADIDLTEPGVASVPDGRRFALETTVTDDYTLTTALQITEK